MDNFNFFHSEGINTFSIFLKKLLQAQEEITGFLKDLSLSFSTEIDLETQGDLDRMLEASKRAEKLIHYGLDLYENQITQEDEWKAMRHDLRAAEGCISGYAELMVEDLEERGAAKLSLLLKLRYIRECAQEQLPFIDKLRVEESVGYITSHGGLYEELAEESPHAKTTKVGRILVVDDDEHKRNILFRRLKKNGHKTLLAENGYRALEILSQESVDLILLDILMPGMNGTEVLKKIKSHEKWCHIPVLVISSLNDVESVVECIKIGAEDYLPMPFNPVLLMARVQACLEKKYLKDQEIERLNELDRMRQHLEAALESMEDGFAVFNMFDEMTMCNKKFQELYPAVKTLYPPDYSYREFLEATYKSGQYQKEKRRASDIEEDFNDWIELRMARHQFAQAPYMEQLSDGRWIEITENRTPDGGTVSIHKDVTHSKEGQDRLKFLAHHDPLTGLANRTLFEDSLNLLYKDVLKRRGTFGILYLDLDGFKKVNDVLGHDFGDHLLIHVAKKLQQSVREDDLVARLGGDEFAIIVYEPGGLEELKTLAQRILRAIGQKVSRGQKHAEFGISIGIALFPYDAHSLEDILIKADQAMYHAKRSGKGVYKTVSDLE